MRTLYLCGAGNSEGVRLALAVNAQQRRWERVVLLDDDPAKHGRSMLGVDVVGPFALLAETNPETSEAASLVARTAARRRQAQQKIAAYGVRLASLVHPGVPTDGVELGDGVLVYQNAILGPEVVVGDASVVFMHAIVGHESIVGAGCIVAAGAVINARVRLGDGVYVGSNATILPEVTIGPGATVAAGSVAVQDVPAGATVLGVPGRIIDFRRPTLNGHHHHVDAAGPAR